MGFEGNLLDGIDCLMPISSADITGQGVTGWSLKSGTARITLSVPSAQVASDTDAQFYVVYYDGTNYHFITANVVASDGVTTIEAAVPGIAGTFTMIISGSLKSTPASTATLVPSP